jgi:DNA mismatch repair protein MutL
MSIRLLSSDVIDQIAAGEVVERPSHMVKELVENSLDAGATEVEVEADQGGRRVRVTDNGQGIAHDQLALALARHATSKISAADDLWRLSSYGFRGEALATVAAVSKMVVTSRKPEAKSASKLTNTFGALSEAEPVGGNPGTTVLVEELFANVPARLKFLKSETAEAQQIKNTIKALALARPDVEFRLRTQGKPALIWSKAKSFKDRAENVLETKPLFTASHELGGFKVQAAFASPHNVGGNARQIWLFVQGRWVQDRGLQAAVIDAYRGLLMHGEYPIAVIHLTCPPDEVDVNIHPAKSAVRFRDAGTAFRVIHRCLREGLEQAPWIDKSQVRAPEQAYTLSSPEPEPQALSFDSAELQRTQYQKRELTAAHYDVVQTAAKAAPEYLTAEAPQHSHQEFVKPADASQQTNKFWSQLQVLGQAHLTYILAENNATLYLIDQHAAHERIGYERLMNAWRTGQIEVQNLLLPLTIQMEPEFVEGLVAQADGLAKIGIELESMGYEAIAVRSMPAGISEKAIASSLKDLAREISEKGGGFALERKVSDLCATMACHSVVRAGQALSIEQMQSLLAQMDEFPLSSFCPHGRPVSVEYPFTKLERDFGRIV